MNIARERIAIDAALDNYRNRLDTIADELFDVTPPGGGWSYAEVYSHIMQATIGATIAAERCANGTTEVTKKGLTFVGRLALFFRYMPKVQVPAAEGAKIQAKKLTKEEARNLLIKCRSRIDTITPRIKDASVKNRFKHSIFGMMNTAHWYKLVLIHLSHHLAQLDRIKNKFAQA